VNDLTKNNHYIYNEEFFIIKLIAYWFILQIFFNDIGNLFTIRIGINLRPDRILFLFIILKTIQLLQKCEFTIKINSIEILILILFSVLLISCIVSGAIHHPKNRHLSTIFNFVAIPGIVFFIARRLEFDSAKIKELYKYFFIIGLYLSFIAFCEHFSIRQLVYPKYIMDPSVGIHWGRARGPFVQAAFLGTILSLLFITSLFYLQCVTKWKTLIYVGLFTMFTSIYFTYTKSNWVMVFTSLLVLGIFSVKFRKFIILFVILLFTLYFSGALNKLSPNRSLFNERQHSIDDRKNIMLAAYLMFLDKPFYGFGYGTFEAKNDKYFVGLKNVELRGDGEGNHNLILGLLAETGLVGTIPFILIIFTILAKSFSLHRKINNYAFFEGQIPLVNISILAGYFIASQLFDPRFSAMLNSLVYITSGITCSMHERYIQNRMFL